MQYLLISAASIVAGLIQGITGFGAVLLLMLFLPMFYALNVSVGVACAISLAVTTSMVITYRKNIDWKKVIIPVVVNIAICTCATYVSLGLNQKPVKKVFGVFLLLLAAYFLFFSKNKNKSQLSLPVSCLLIVGGAVCEGFFGIGGPLMVIYFVNKTDSKEEYLAAISGYFMATTVVNTIVRFASGVLTVKLLPIIITGIVFVLIGGIIAKRVVNKLDASKVRTATYVMIAIAGLINIIR